MNAIGFSYISASMTSRDCTNIKLRSAFQQVSDFLKAKQHKVPYFIISPLLTLIILLALSTVIFRGLIPLSFRVTFYGFLASMLTIAIFASIGNKFSQIFSSKYIPLKKKYEVYMLMIGFLIGQITHFLDKYIKFSAYQ